MKPIRFIFLSFFLLTLGVAAQDEKSQSALLQAEQRVRVWQTRVDDLSKEIMSESSAVSGAEQSLYFALLAKMWWKIDEPEARIHLKKAVTKIIGAISAEDKKDLEKELKFSQKSLEIIIGLDKKLAQDLIGQIESSVDGPDDNNKKDSQALADMFVGIGLQIVDSNPGLGSATGHDSLIYGFGSGLPTLITQLHQQNSLLAESLLRKALTKANGGHTDARDLFLYNLNRYMVEFNKGKPFSEELQRLVLEVFAEALRGAASNENLRRQRCGIAFYARLLLPRIAEFLPGHLLEFQQNLGICAANASTSTRERVEAATREDAPKTVDEMLRAARNESSLEVKINLYRDALYKLQQEKKFAEMVSVLDGLDGDEFYKIAPKSWGNWRIDAGHRGAIAAFEANDLPAAYRYIDRTPKHLRPFVRSELVAETAVRKDSEFFLVNLDEMQKELKSLEITNDEGPHLYLELAHNYLIARPTEAESMFRLAMTYINKTDADNPDFRPDKDWATHEDYIRVNSDLLEIDEQSITTSLKSVSSRRSRVRLKLGLLESSLVKFVEAKKKLAETLKAAKTAKDTSVKAEAAKKSLLL